MSHNKHIEDGFNKDIGMMQPDQAIEHYLEMAKGWSDPNPPIVETIHDGIRVVRDDLIIGTKQRSADLLMSTVKEDTVAYILGTIATIFALIGNIPQIYHNIKYSTKSLR